MFYQNTPPTVYPPVLYWELLIDWSNEVVCCHGAGRARVGQFPAGCEGGKHGQTVGFIQGTIGCTRNSVPLNTHHILEILLGL